MRHVEVLAPHPEPIVVVMAPRMRCGRADYDVLEYYLHDLKVLERPVTFRVSGMIIGVEEFVERLAPPLGHRVEVYGPEDQVKRLNKYDDLERDVTSLIGAHALWVWPTTSEVDENNKVLDYEMIGVAQDLGVPVLLFLPAASQYEVLEL